MCSNESIVVLCILSWLVITGSCYHLCKFWVFVVFNEGGKVMNRLALSDYIIFPVRFGRL